MMLIYRKGEGEYQSPKMTCIVNQSLKTKAKNIKWTIRNMWGQLKLYNSINRGFTESDNDNYTST